MALPDRWAFAVAIDIDTPSPELPYTALFSTVSPSLPESSTTMPELELPYTAAVLDREPVAPGTGVHHDPVLPLPSATACSKITFVAPLPARSRNRQTDVLPRSRTEIAIGGTPGHCSPR